ncbi:MAG: porin [Bacteroides sp.]|nr:porin [Bacteroides sp.]
MGEDPRLPAYGTNYDRRRWGIGTEIKTSLLYLRAEYLKGKDDVRKSEGYYATASVPVHPKVDLIASYDYFNKDKELSRKQTNYILGAQYNFYKRCRMQAQYIFQDRQQGMKNVNQIQTQLQVGF